MLVKAGLKTYEKFPIAADNVTAQKTKRAYCSQQQADLDIKTSNNLIGDIINCSQELNTIIWDSLNAGKTVEDVMDIYLDVCKLNVAQTIEIDKAKKEFTINNSKELGLLRNKYCILDEDNRKIKPAFFAAKDKGKGYYDPEHKNYAKHDTTMDYLQTVVNSWVYKTGRYLGKNKYLPLSKILDTADKRNSRISESKISKAMGIINDSIKDENEIYNLDIEQKDKFRLASERRQECVDAIGNMVFGISTMAEFIRRIEQDENKKIKTRVMNILFGFPNSSFYNVLHKSTTPVTYIEECCDGDIKIYDFSFSKKQ